MMSCLGSTRHRPAVCLAIIALAVAVLPGRATAGPPLAPVMAAKTLAQVRYIYHGLGVQPPHRKTQKGKVKMKLFNQYLLQTRTKQRASIRFQDGTMLHMNQMTDAVLRSPHLTYVKHGEVDEILAPGSNHQVQTSSAVAAAIGTNFDVKRVGKATVFVVVHGALLVKNRQGSQTVKTNQQSIVLPQQAPQPPTHVNAQQAVSWTNGMPSPKLGENIALDANGGRIVAYSSEYFSQSQGDFWDVKFINDGRLDYGWETAPGDTTNQWVKLGFAGNGSYLISKVIIDPSDTHPSSANANLTDLKDFQIRVSTTGTDDADFTTVLTGTCQMKNSLQQFPLPSPVPAKYVELYALDNYGSPDWISVAELEVVGTPAPPSAVPTPTPAPTSTP